MISAEHAVSILRYHPKGDYGSPFTFSCVMLRFQSEATLSAANGVMTREIWNELTIKLRNMGIARVRFIRKTQAGIDRLRTINIGGTT